MNILVLGKNGQLGSSLIKQLSSCHRISFLGRQDLDLTKTTSIQKIIASYQPNIIINAAAYTSVESAEYNRDLAFRVNSDAVLEMARYAKSNDCILYHYSTDYVFDGLTNRPYLESDPPNPINIYGASKYTGEQHILNSGCQYYIFRTSWVYSETGHNFIKTILNLIQQKRVLKIVNDQFGTPTSANFIASMTNTILTTNLPYGLYHLTPSGSTSWYEYASYLVEKIYGLEEKKQLESITSELYESKVKRPLHSKLDSSLLSNCLNIEFPSWQEVLELEIQKFK
jgi:dTDP-4-dehydrorhamnose reductase